MVLRVVSPVFVFPSVTTALWFTSPAHFLSGTTCITTVFSGFPIRVQVTQPEPNRVVHGVHVLLLLVLKPVLIAETTIRPKESTKPTTAGTNAN